MYIGEGLISSKDSIYITLGRIDTVHFYDFGTWVSNGAGILFLQPCSQRLITCSLWLYAVLYVHIYIYAYTLWVLEYIYIYPIYTR